MGGIRPCHFFAPGCLAAEGTRGLVGERWGSGAASATACAVGDATTAYVAACAGAGRQRSE